MSNWIAVLNTTDVTLRGRWVLRGLITSGDFGAVDDTSEVVERGIAVGALLAVPEDTEDPDAIAALAEAEAANLGAHPPRRPTGEERLSALEELDLESPAGAQAKVDAAIAALIVGAPGALDTLTELAAALGDDANFAATVANSLAELEADVAEHVALTLAAHGIGDTSLLETQAGAQARVDAHGALTLEAHGIPNTALLETQAGAQAKVDAAITALVGGAPGALDTLVELAAALNDDANFSATVTNSLATLTNAVAAEEAARIAADVGVRQLLERVEYGPAVLGSWGTSSIVHVDVDATNLAITVTVPASGNLVLEAEVYAQLLHSSNAARTVYLGWRVGAALVAGTGRAFTTVREQSTVAKVLGRSGRLRWYLNGLTPGATTFKLSWRVDNADASAQMFADDGGLEIGPAVLEAYTAA